MEQPSHVFVASKFPGSAVPQALQLSPRAGVKERPCDKITNFPNFRFLPMEIRDLIWEYCLPQRIIPFSVLAFAFENSRAEPSNRFHDRLVERVVSSAMITPLLVPHICAGSRRVAQSGRLPVEELDMPWLGGHRWFDPRTDILLLDCDFRERYHELWSLVRRKLLPSAAGEPPLPGQRDIRIGLSENLAENENPNAPNAGQCLEACGNIKQKRWPMVLQQSISPPPAELGSAVLGIHGPSGEETQVVVDISSRTQLLRLFSFLRSLGPHKIEESCVNVPLKRWKRCVEHLSSQESSDASGSSSKLPQLPDLPEEPDLAKVDYSSNFVLERAEARLVRFLSGLEQRHPVPYPVVVVDRS